MQHAICTQCKQRCASLQEARRDVDFAAAANADACNYVQNVDSQCQLNFLLNDLEADPVIPLKS